MPQSERVLKFLKALGEMGILRFELANLEKVYFLQDIIVYFTISSKFAFDKIEVYRHFHCFCAINMLDCIQDCSAVIN